MIRITHAAEPKAVELEYLTGDGVVIVCDSGNDYRDFLRNIAMDFAQYLQHDTDTFDPVMVKMVLDGEPEAPGVPPELGYSPNDWDELITHFLDTRPETPKAEPLTADAVVAEISELIYTFLNTK